MDKELAEKLKKLLKFLPDITLSEAAKLGFLTAEEVGTIYISYFLLEEGKERNGEET